MAYNITEMRSSSTIKKVLFITSVIICLIIIQNLARGIYDLWRKQDLVIEAQTDLKKEKEENQKLKAKLIYVTSQEFIEKEARNKLLLVKSGESEIIVPQELILKKAIKKEEILPNWKQWVNLFIYPR